MCAHVADKKRLFNCSVRYSQYFNQTGWEHLPTDWGKFNYDYTMYYIGISSPKNVYDVRGILPRNSLVTSLVVGLFFILVTIFCDC